MNVCGQVMKGVERGVCRGVVEGVGRGSVTGLPVVGSDRQRQVALRLDTGIGYDQSTEPDGNWNARDWEPLDQIRLRLTAGRTRLR
jgi:hypothetical protein